MLKEAPSPKESASTHTTHLANLLKVNSHEHFTQKQAKELRVLVQKSVGANDSAISIQITQTIQEIKLPNSQSEKIEAEMTDIMRFNDSVIMTIPSIGYIFQNRPRLNLLFSSVRDIVLRMFSKMNKFENFTPSFICVLHTFGRT